MSPTALRVMPPLSTFGSGNGVSKTQPSAWPMQPGRLCGISARNTYSRISLDSKQGDAPERGAGAALVLSACNTEAMQLHLDEIATKIAPGGSRYSVVAADTARGRYLRRSSQPPIRDRASRAAEGAPADNPL
jgi:hypothetical protein